MCKLADSFAVLQVGASMAERLVFFSIGDRFATMTKDGRVQIWEVDEQGIPREAEPLNQPDIED